MCGSASFRPMQVVGRGPKPRITAGDDKSRPETDGIAWRSTCEVEREVGEVRSCYPQDKWYRCVRCSGCGKRRAGCRGVLQGVV